MMEGLDETEEKHYFNENLKIIPLFEMDILQALTPYVEDQRDTVPIDGQTIKESRLQQEACEKEMLVSQRVQASSLEELNLSEEESRMQPKAMLIAKEKLYDDKQRLKNLLKHYTDVFAWSFEDMQGLDTTFCQHQIHLNKDAKPVQQRRYRLNPNYVVKVKEEINKILKVRFSRPFKKTS